MSQFLKFSALLIISTILALSVAEAALRFMGRPPLYVNNEHLVFWTHDPLLGWAHRPGQQGVFEKPSQFVTHVSVNQKGLRDDDHAYARSGDRKRVLVLGDSFGWGYGVDHSERFSEVLESTLGIEVINASISGYSTDQQLLWLRDEGVKYDFDLIVLALCGNDEHDNHRLRHYIVYNKPRFEITGDTLALRGVPIAAPPVSLRLERFLRRKSALANTLAHELRALHGRLMLRFEAVKTIHTSVMRNPDPPWNLWTSQESPFALTRRLIGEIRQTAEAQTAGFMIVSTPRYWTDVPSNVEGTHNGGTYPDFINSLRADGFLLLDVESSPSWDSDGMVIPHDGHWNAAGHQFVAGQVQRFIEEHQLLNGPAIRER